MGNSTSTTPIIGRNSGDVHKDIQVLLDMVIRGGVKGCDFGHPTEIICSQSAASTKQTREGGEGS